MLPTPSWLKFKNWRSKRATGAHSAHQVGGQAPAAAAVTAVASGLAGAGAEPTAEAESRLASDERVAPMAEGPVVEATSSCDLPGGGYNFERWPPASEPPPLPPPQTQQQQRHSRPQKRLGHLIPRSLSNLIGRALSPASSMNQQQQQQHQETSATSSRTKSKAKSKTKARGAPRATATKNNSDGEQQQQREQQQQQQAEQENETPTSNADCRLPQSPDLIAHNNQRTTTPAGPSAARPMSPLRKFRRHLSAGDGASGTCPDGAQVPGTSSPAQGDRGPLEALEARATNKQRQESAAAAQPQTVSIICPRPPPAPLPHAPCGGCGGGHRVSLHSQWPARANRILALFVRRSAPPAGHHARPPAQNDQAG